MIGAGFRLCPFHLSPNLETYEWCKPLWWMLPCAYTRKVPQNCQSCYPANKLARALLFTDTYMSEAHVDAKPSINGWGGKRNSRDRVTHALPLAKAQAIIGGAYRAIKIGLPFNRFVTLHLERAGLTDAIAADAIGRIIKLASDWMRTKGQAFTWEWIRENDVGDGSKGSHVHILCHCPDTIPIGRMWLRWLRKVSGRPYRAKAIKSERIGGTLNVYATSPALYLQNLDRVLAYVCKGVSPADTATLGLPKHEAGGRIIGKRAGWSQNVGEKSLRLATRC